MRSSIPALVQKYSFYNEYYDFSNYNTDYLLKENYDAKWHQLIQSASGPVLTRFVPKNSEDLILVHFGQAFYLTINSSTSIEEVFESVSRIMRIPTEQDGSFPTAYMNSYLTIYKNTWCIVTPKIGPSTEYYQINSVCFESIPAVPEYGSFLIDLCLLGDYLPLLEMPDVDIKAESVNNYIKEFLKEIDSAFLDPNFNTFDILNNDYV